MSILSAATAWHGIRVLRYKGRRSAHRHPVDLFISILLFLSGICICMYGFSISSPLLSWFPLIGVGLGAAQLAYWLRPPRERMHWLFEHFTGMLACCISTITAFVVFGGPRLLDIQSRSLFLWFLPTILLVPVIIGFSIHYRRKFSTAKRA